MSTVLIDFRSISWGGPNEDDNTNVWQLEDSNSDPSSEVLENLGSVGDPVVNFPAPATQGPNNELLFAFWNATNGSTALPGFPSADPQRKLNIPKQPDGTIVQATAWYAPPPGDGPGGKPGLRARTFDIDLNGFRKETPIQSANPAAAWAGPNNHSVVTDIAAVTATAKDMLLYPAALSSQPPGEPRKEFKHWQAIVGALTIGPAKVAGCAKTKSALALAFYGHADKQRLIDKSITGMLFDFWAEFWGKRGAEGEGPFGPNGPGDPWGPFVARLMATLPQDQLKARLEGEIANLQALVKRMDKKQR